MLCLLPLQAADIFLDPMFDVEVRNDIVFSQAYVKYYKIDGKKVPVPKGQKDMLMDLYHPKPKTSARL